jgi:3-oxoacyl-[acyl-carrier protein] reductase
MLQNRVALVTGGSGAVGEATVRVLVREGCRVAFTYKNNSERAKMFEAELNAADSPHPNPLPKGEGTGRRVAAYPLDVLDGKAAAALAEIVEREFGPVDILVNNAGFAQVLPFAMIEEDDWDKMMDVNVKVMFLVTKAFARGMIRRKRGSIVNVSSLAGVRMLEVPVHYATAKSAAVGFTLSLARELGRYKVRVNAVVPGMLTDGVSVNVPVKQQEEYKQYCALSRVGTPAEVGELIAFLASDRAGYINGQAIHIDGGI